MHADKTRMPAKALRMLYVSALALTINIILAGCPGAQKAGNKGNNPVTEATGVPDSTALIGHLSFLTSPAMEGRESATPGNLRARQYIVQYFDSLQLQKAGDSYLQPFPLRNDTTRSGYNVIGMIKGSRYPDKYLAITAHYDHLGIRNGKVYVGADDNASGTACLLTLAKYFKQHPPRHSIILVACDAEEKGLLGSRYFVDHAPVPLQNIVMNINMDMISRNDQNEIYACGTFHYPYLKKYVDSVQALTPVSIRFGHDDASKGRMQDWTTQSDHYSFHLKKIPFIYFGVEDHPDYHQPGDTFDKINKSFYFQVSGMIAKFVLLMDRQDQIQ